MYCDDVVFLAKTKADSATVYHSFFNFLQSVSLNVQLHKVQQGAFRTAVLDYCGWRFSGGYAAISDGKVQLFKEKIRALCKTTVLTCVPSFIKKINQQINGFGHYYKYGQVKGAYEKWDAFIRQQLRKAFTYNCRKSPTTLQLKKMGLRSLLDILVHTKPLAAVKKEFIWQAPSKPKETHQTTLFFSYLEKLIHQNAEMIGILKNVEKLLTV